MALKVKPLADRVVVEPAPAEEVSTGGIILPDTVQEKPQQGTIVATGPGKVSDAGTTIAMEVKKVTKFYTVNIAVQNSPLKEQIFSSCARAIFSLSYKEYLNYG